MRTCLYSRRLLVPLCLAAVAGVSQPPAQTTTAGPASGIEGGGSTGVAVMNLSHTDPANLVFRFAKHGGAAPIEVARANVPPGSPSTVYLPAEAALANGAYALEVLSDQPIGAVSHTAWSPNGGIVEANAAEAGRDIIVPLLYRRFNGRTSVMAVQNTSPDAAATVDLEVFASGLPEPQATLSFALPAGAGRTLNLTDASLAALPDLLAGWGRITASQPIAVQSVVDSLGMAGFGVAGVPVEGAAATLHAPMVYNAFVADPSAVLTSGVTVLNPGAEPVSVRVRYHGADAGSTANACAGQTIEHNGGVPVVLAPGEMQTFNQGTGPLSVAGPSGLAPSCAASAVIETTGGAVLAVVSIQGGGGKQTVAAYEAVAAGGGDRRVALPLVRREHTTARLTTAIQVQNLADAPAAVTLRVRDSRGTDIPCDAACSGTIPPGASRLWWPMDISAWPAGTYGEAWIDSDQPVAAVVNDLSLDNGLDQAAYVGLPGSGTRVARFPLALKAHTLIPLSVTQTPSVSPAPTLTRTPTAPPTSGPSPTPTQLPTGGGQKGAGTSGMLVVNLSSSDAADIGVGFHGYSGRAPVTVDRRGVAAGAAASIYLPAEPELSNDFYAARATSAQPIAALGRTDWSASGGALVEGPSEPSTDVIVPLLLRGLGGQDSLVAIHNASADTATQVAFQIFASGQREPLVVWRDRLHAGRSTVIDLKTHPVGLALPGSVALWGRLTADVPIAVTSIVNAATTARTVYDVAGVPAERASVRLAAPMAFNAFKADDSNGALTSGISVLNPGAAPVQVRVTYRGADTGDRANACAGQTIEHNGGAPVTLAPGELAIFYQGDVSIPVTGRSGLPANCAASAVVEATGAVLAVVNAAHSTHGTGGAYGAVSDVDAGRRVALPMIRREHTPARLTTPIQVQNLADAPASATLRLRDSRGLDIACGSACQATIPPGGSRLWWPTDVAAWPAGTYGSAWVESSQPVAVVVDDLSLSGAYDQAIYVGLVDRGAREQVMPLLMGGGRPSASLPTPTDTPTPTATPTPTPTPTPRPAYLPLLRHDAPQG